MSTLRAVVVLALCACTPSPPRVPAEEAEAVAIDAEHALIKTGPVGYSQRSDATYVLVDVVNRSTKDRVVAIAGDLLDDAGKAIAPIGDGEIRVPAGGARTFALLADRVVPAKRASYRLLHAMAVDYPPQIEITPVELARSGELTVATAKAKNVIDKDATATFVASFYDKDNRILTRPVVIVPLPIGTTRQLRFEGPKDADHAVIYVVEMTFT